MPLSPIERHRRWRARKRAAGYCGRCGQRPASEGKFHCERCLIVRRVSRRKSHRVEE